MSKPLIHLCDRRRCRPFLGPENRAASVLTAKDIRHITCNTESAFLQFRDYKFICNHLQFPQTCCSIRYLVSFPVKETIPQRLEHPNTPVIRGASSDSYNELPASLRDRVTDHLANTVCRSVKRVPFFLRNKYKTCRSCHLDYRSSRLFDHSVSTVDRITQRACHLYFPDFPIHITDQGLNRSFPSVRQRLY